MNDLIPWKLDGMLIAMSGSPTRLFRVFAPRWWELGRWLSWFFWCVLGGRFGFPVIGFTTITLLDGSVRLRMHSVKNPPNRLRRRLH